MQHKNNGNHELFGLMKSKRRIKESTYTQTTHTFLNKLLQQEASIPQSCYQGASSDDARNHGVQRRLWSLDVGTAMGCRSGPTWQGQQVEVREAEASSVDSTWLRSDVQLPSCQRLQFHSMAELAVDGSFCLIRGSQVYVGSLKYRAWQKLYITVTGFFFLPRNNSI